MNTLYCRSKTSQCTKYRQQATRAVTSLDRGKRRSGMVELVSKKGNFRVIAVGENCTVKFINYDGTEYAKARIASNYKESIEKTIDSSRGYAVRLTADDGRQMWVGLRFHDRNDAFDFNAAFEDFERKRNMEKNPHLFKNQNRPQVDFSLKPGQMINIQLGAGDQNKAQVQTQNTGGAMWDNPFEKKPQTQTSSSGG